MNKSIKKPELVSPAGDWSSLYSAIAGGCDSLYFGVKHLNMRSLATNFDILELKKIMDILRKNGKRGYLALNVIVYNRELKKVRKILEEAKKAKVDGVILWDMAVFDLAKSLGLKIHISTQASVSNLTALRYYHSLGTKRVVLARECRLSDAKNIASAVSKLGIDCEIEAFIHGAMCLSVSGRCFLSEFSFSKSANRGQCIQPCRREYRVIDAEGECEYVLGKDYILSPKDLCTLEFVDSLIKAGINAFKIEGRIRSPEYIGVVTHVYRRAIDACFRNKFTEKLKSKLMSELHEVYNRGFSSGFYWGEPKKSVSRDLESTHEKVYLGEVVKFYKKINVAEVRVRNGILKKGDKVLCMGKNTPASFATVKDIQINHNFVDRISKGQTAGVKLPFAVKHNDKVFIWREKGTSAG